MASFEVLMPLPGMPEIAERLEPRVTLHKLWAATDREATLARIAPHVRAVVSTWATARVDAELMRRLPKLEIVVGFGVGYDHIDAAWAGQHGIVVTHTPGVLDEDVADIAIALTLAATRRLPQAERHLRDGRWPNGSFPLTASLHGRVMGILGLGRTGRARILPFRSSSATAYSGSTPRASRSANRGGKPAARIFCWAEAIS